MPPVHVNDVPYPAGVVLGAVFAWAGGAKLARPAVTAAGLDALGIPSATGVARVLPILELGIAVALLTVPLAGGILALATLVAFSWVLATRIKAGAQSPCACFGTASQDAVSVVDLVRNALLGVLAVAALFASQPHWPSLEATIVVSCSVVSGVLIVRMSRLHRQLGALWSNSEAREGVRP